MDRIWIWIGLIQIRTSLVPVHTVPTTNIEGMKPLDKKKNVDVPRRRPDIDVIIIALTWAIMLYHCVQQVRGNSSFFIRFMKTWNMPMFFYLSGIIINWEPAL